MTGSTVNAVPASGSALHLPDYLVPLFGKFICFAIVALAWIADRGLDYPETFAATGIAIVFYTIGAELDRRQHREQVGEQVAARDPRACCVEACCGELRRLGGDARQVGEAFGRADAICGA